MKKANFKLVKFDTTFGWDENFLKQLGITKIFTWYIFDANEVTNCCELMPSYECIPVYEAPENEFDMTDENKDEFYDYMGLNPQDDTQYIHCSSVDPIAQDLPSEFKMKYIKDFEGKNSSWLTALEASAIFNQAYLHLL
jgi:hypothetical protein